MKRNNAMRLSGLLVCGAVLLVLAGCPAATGAPPDSEFLISFKANGTPVTMTAGPNGTFTAIDSTEVTFDGVPAYLSLIPDAYIVAGTTTFEIEPFVAPFIVFYVSGIAGTGIYDLDSSAYVLVYIADESSSYTSYVGTLEITEFGGVNGTIRGTFSASLDDGFENTIDITEGTLVVKRYPDFDLGGGK